MITAKNNQKIKQTRKLLTSVKERRESGLFVAEGYRICTEIPEELLDCLYISQSCAKRFAIDEQAQSAGIIEGLKKNGFHNINGRTAVEIVEESIFKGISDTVNPQGILAVVKQPSWNDAQISVLHRKILLLDGVRDPGNMGTILRTAEAAGVVSIYMSNDCVDLYNPKVIRSTMGSIFRVPTFSCELVPKIKELKARGIKVYGSSLEAVKSHKDVDLFEAAIVIGSEAEGATAEVLANTTENIKIPMAGEVESLNAAISAAILMFA